MKDIFTPCHQSPLLILVSGNGDIEILCPADRCYNEWDKDGRASPYNKV